MLHGTCCLFHYSVRHVPGAGVVAEVELVQGNGVEDSENDGVHEETDPEGLVLDSFATTKQCLEEDKARKRVQEEHDHANTSVVRGNDACDGHREPAEGAILRHPSDRPFLVSGMLSEDKGHKPALTTACKV